jgi:hypothetical protein
MLSIIPAFLIFVSSFLQDPSGSWIPSAESENEKYYFKSKYISKVGSKITIWVKTEYNVPKDLFGKKESYLLHLEECDCSDFSQKTKSGIAYSQSGEYIFGNNYKDPDMIYAPPGTVSYRYINDICTRFNKKKK